MLKYSQKNRQSDDVDPIVENSDKDNQPQIKVTGSTTAFDNNDEEEQEQEQDPAKPFEAIQAIHDIDLGCAVHQMAVAPLPAEDRPRDTLPSVFNNTILVAAACSDRTVELVSLPLNPSRPHIETKAHGKKIENGVERVEVASPEEHPIAPRGVALSYTNVSQAFEDYDEAMDIVAENSTQIPRIGAWQLLVASHSWGPNGVLVVSRIQLSSNNSSLNEATVLADTIYIKSMATAISFNPARYPSPRHSQLLVADTTGAVRLYETAMARRSSISRPGKSPALRTQLRTTFFTHYQSRPASGLQTSRHKLLDATWAVDGKCIIALLDNALWGIWDFSEAGPQAGLKRGHVGPQSVPGTGSTKFSIQGNLPLANQDEPEGPAVKAGSVRDPAKQTLTALAPMTPKTRKTREEILFTQAAGGLKPVRLTRGRLAVSTATGANGNDEDVIISYGSDFFCIPKLMSTWKRAQDTQKAQGGVSGLATLHAPSPEHLADLSTLGEMVTNVSHFPSDASFKPSASSQDILIAAEHRLIIWSPGKRSHKPVMQLENLFTRPVQPTDESSAVRRIDQDRLKRGELDLGGMDRMLASMNRRPDGNADWSDGSPLMAKANSSRLRTK